MKCMRNTKSILITKKRLFFEKMEEVLPGVKVVITDGDTETMLPLDSFLNDSSLANNGLSAVGDGANE